MAKLIISKNKKVIREFLLIDQETIIGRHPSCTVFLSDSNVSRKHAKITLETDGYHICDLESKNGTIVNRKKVPEKLLEHEDVMRFGEFEVTYIKEEIDDEIIALAKVKKPEKKQKTPEKVSQKSVDDSDLNAVSRLYLERNESSVSSELNPNESKVDMKLYRALEEKAQTFEKDFKKFAILYEITNRLNSILNLEDLLKSIVDTLLEILNAEKGVIFLFNKNRKLIPAVSKNRSSAMDSSEILKISSTIAKEVLKTKKPVITTNAAMDDRFSGSASISEYNLGAVACLPVMFKNEMLGTIYIANESENIFTESDADFLMLLAAQAGTAIAVAKMHKETLDNKEFETDLAVAKEMQENLLPDKIPSQPGFFSIAAKTVFAREIGGDYYDFIESKDRKKVGIVIADASGKGVSAAFIISMARSLLKVFGTSLESPSKVCSKVNELLLNDLSKGKFITALFAVYDSKTGILNLAKCGHEDPVLLRGKNLTSLDSSGLPLGLYEDGQYFDKIFTLQPSDKVIFFTDGIIEAANSSGELYGAERFDKFLLAHKELSNHELLDALFDEIKKFSGGDLRDDTTAVILEVNRVE